jgi:LysR family transcriptional regulator, transcriptional activator of the cysJI operon
MEVYIMTIRNLEIFVKVADLGNMTAAAQSLYIAQPTVSQAISEIESHYGIKLFDRLAKRLYITESGKQLLSYARHIIALDEEMELAMKDPEKSGILKVGASLTIGAELMPKLASGFQEKHGELRIHAVVRNTADIESLILRNDIDFALVEGIVHSKSIIAEPFMDDELALVCGKSHALYGIRSVTLEELLKHDFVVREQGSGTRELFESAMISKNAAWNISWECSGSDSIKSAAAGGLGIGVISKRLVEREIAVGELVVLTVPGLDLKRKFSIAYHKNKYITDTMKEFFSMVR